MDISFLFEDKYFYKTMFKIAIPLALQNLILSSLNLVDTIIIGGLGEQAIASVGLANQYFFLLNLLLFGVSSGASIFTAQYWGKKDVNNIKRVLGICLITGGIASLCFTFIGLLFPSKIMSVFSNDPVVIKNGTEYLRIIVFSYFLTSITFSYSFILRSTAQVKIPMIVSAIALGINTFLNYCLVYGYIGMPKLGIKGSALATLIARVVEMTLLITIVYKNDMILAGKFSELFDLSKKFIKDFFTITIPVIINESMWAIGVTMYSIVYARMGTAVIASTNISSTVEKITWVIFMGIGNSAAVMIGNKIGEGKENIVYTYAKRFLIIGPMLGIFMGILVVLFSHYILLAFNVSSTVYNYAVKNLLVFAAFLSLKAFNFITIVGIFRSGGDTKYGLLVDTGGVWFVGVPLAFIGAFFLHLPVYLVYAMLSLEEVFKIIISIPRILSKKWIRNLVRK